GAAGSSWRSAVLSSAAPSAASATLRGARRPGGRVAFACGRSVDKNPMMAAPMAAAAKYSPPLPPPDPHAPGPFAFADRGRVARILEAAGFCAVGIEPHDEPVGGNDRADTLELALNLGPLGRLLREHPERRAVATAAVRDAIQPFIVDGVARFPTATWIVTAKS